MSKPDANFIWAIANLLRGPYKPKEYGDVILPMTILRRLDCVLAPQKDELRKEWLRLKDKTSADILHVKLRRKFGHNFYNTSRYTVRSLTGDSANVKANLLDYLDGFSENIRDVFLRFGFEEQIHRLDEANALYLIVQRFAALDLRPENVSNTEMGTVFEELIRKFAEASNETAGEHFTPREVIALMVDLLLVGDEEATSKENVIRTVYDPTAGTGGMLSTMDEHLRLLNETARLTMAGQEINPSSYAVCKAELVIKGQDINAVALGNTLTDDQHAEKSFHYCLSNPPFGVEWKPSERDVRREHKQMGMRGRFGPGLPGISDGAMLFLQHLISKMRPVDPDDPKTRGRAAIVLNGSPLFTGKAGSGESEIRRWIVENDLLDAIIALPTDMFYNTGIATYVWILDKRKPENRRGKVQLIDGSQMFVKIRKSLGSKRKELASANIDAIVRMYGAFDGSHNANSKVLQNTDFGYRTIAIERPLRLSFQASPDRIAATLENPVLCELLDGETIRDIRAVLEGLDPNAVVKDRAEFIAMLADALRGAHVRVAAPIRKLLLDGLGHRDATAKPCLNAKGEPEPDPKLRDFENVPLNDDIHDYFKREVFPYVPDAWIDESKTKIGYEIPFTRYFYGDVLSQTRVQSPTQRRRPATDLPDLQMAKIDVLMTAQNSLSQKLKERRLSDAVSSMLVGYEEIRLKYLTEYVRQGFSPQCESYAGDPKSEWCVLKVGCVNYGAFRPDENKLLPSDIEPRPEIVVNRGDLVVSRANTRELVGSAAVVQDEFPYLMLSDKTYALTLDQSRIIPEFASFVLGTPRLRRLIELEATGASHSMQNISQADILNLPVPVPPLPDQQRILQYLGDELPLVDQMIVKANELAEALKSRRAALIAGVVTGKIDVVNHNLGQP